MEARCKSRVSFLTQIYMNLEQDCLIHDIENYPNLLSDIFKVPKKNEIYILILYKGLTDSLKSDIVKAFSDKGITCTIFNSVLQFQKWFPKEKYLVGYNSLRYDDVLLSEVMSSYSHFVTYKSIEIYLTHLYEFGNKLINEPTDYTLDNLFKTLDVQRIAGLDRIFKPLKQTAANLKHHTIRFRFRKKRKN